MTDYEQWKQWFDKWNVFYGEREDSIGKILIVPGLHCEAIVEFDKNGKFLYMTAQE